MKILISNDDGIYSPGIVALANVASSFGDVRIVAPDVEQSSMSHAITSTRPIRFKKVAVGDFEAYRVNGTPADCVALGTHNWGRVDIGEYDGKVVRSKDPMGRPIFWFTVKPLDDEVEGTDRWAFMNRWVSITPLRLDLTAEKDLARALSVPEIPAVSTKPQRKSA